MERLISERKKDGGKARVRAKQLMTDPPLVDSEPEPEIGYKSKSD